MSPHGLSTWDLLRMNSIHWFMDATVQYPGLRYRTGTFHLRMGFDWLADAFGDGDTYCVAIYGGRGLRKDLMQLRWADGFEKAMDLWEEEFQDGAVEV